MFKQLETIVDPVDLIGNKSAWMKSKLMEEI